MMRKYSSLESSESGISSRIALEFDVLAMIGGTAAGTETMLSLGTKRTENLIMRERGMESIVLISLDFLSS